VKTDTALATDDEVVVVQPDVAPRGAITVTLPKSTSSLSGTHVVGTHVTIKNYSSITVAIVPQSSDRVDSRDPKRYLLESGRSAKFQSFYTNWMVFQ
jgi:hypothetical protein